MLSPAVFAQSLNDFQSIGAVRMQDTIQIPFATHNFQVIARAGEPLTAGGIKGTNSDFTGFVPINGSSTEGYLCINSEFLDTDQLGIPEAVVGNLGSLIPALEESDPDFGGGGVDIYHIKYNPNRPGWDLVNSRKATFGTLATGNAETGVNCSGMVTPWETVVTCEEVSSLTISAQLPGFLQGLLDANEDTYYDIGWCLEIDPVTGEAMDYDNDGENDKLWGMGNMAHENLSEPVGDSIVYFGEDNSPGEEDNYVYKFVADTPGNLYSGKLYALVLDPNDNTRADWALIPNTTPEECNDAIIAARNAGAWNVPRVEDVEVGPHDGKVYISSTAFNQIIRFDDMGDDVENLEVYIDNIDYTVDSLGLGTGTVNFNSPDNLCFDSEGNLYVMQDGGEGYIFFVDKAHTPANPNLSIFLSAAFGAEPTGMTLTPDNKFMFVSIQHPSESNTLTSKKTAPARPML